MSIRNWFAVKINHDYFSLSSKMENIKYFAEQGFLFNHLIDRIKWHYAPSFFYVLRFPSHIDIEASNMCQMSCPMCGRHLMKNIKQGHMDFDLYKKIIDECSREKVYSIKLSWRGEPLLNPNIAKMINYAKEKGIKDVAFLTNGERLNENLTNQLIESGLDWISISFDGLNDVYEKIRYPAKFEKAVKEIKYIKKTREQKRLKKPLIRIQSIWSAIKNNPDEFKDFWKPVADRINFIADQIRSREEKDFSHDPNYICQSPWQRICIMWDGRVAQCHGDYLERNILGDVKANTLREIWHGEKFNNLRSLMRNKKRLDTPPCKICCDGGITQEENIIVEDKKMKILKYIGQELDVASMDARPGARK